jgi:hypothetical protein
MHWVNAVVMLVMITSGWGIYDDDVIIRGFHFSSFWRLGDWAAWSLNWHFAGMWFLVINGLIYLTYGFVTGRFRKKLLPIRPAEVVQTVIDTLHFKIAHEDITVYNAVQKLLYIIVILAGISQVVTGTRHLEACAVLRPGFITWRLSDCAGAAFRRDGGDRWLPDRACGACASRAQDPVGDGRRWAACHCQQPSLRHTTRGKVTRHEIAVSTGRRAGHRHP